MAAQYCIFISLFIFSCNGQLADLFLPTSAHSVRQLIDVLTKQPIVRLTTQTTGNLITDSVNLITSVPIAVARSLNIGNSLPTLIKNTNVLHITDSIIDNYTAGLSNDDARLSIGDLVVKYGFPLEKHQVVTDDGYMLSLFRIPGSGSVVLLMHGLLGSADDFVTAGPESGLAYLLAREGYDVWMGNARGNKYSRRHLKLHPSEANFWDFSWHEIGCHDLPAMIDYVLRKTGKSKLKYIGHSQGNTCFFVMASERPEYNKHISLMVALSPVAFMSKAKSPVFRLLAPTGDLLHGLAKMFGIYEFLPDFTVTKTLKRIMCGISPISEILCSNFLFLLVGFSIGQLNVTNLPVFYGHVPSGASVKQLVHYSQGLLSDDFRQFDYGSVGNFKKYGTNVPPSYELNKVQSPVALFYSDNDWLAHTSDVQKLHGRLGKIVDVHKIPLQDFNHLDFVWAKDFKELVYKRLHKLLRLF